MKKMTTRRKLAIATWKAASSGNIYGKLTIDMDNPLKYIDYLKKTTGEKITITHLVGKAVANALKQAPDVNGRIVLGKYIPFENVNISFLVALQDGQDLAKVKVEDADKKSTVDIAKELQKAAKKLRKGKDDAFNKSKPVLKMLPTWLIRPLLTLTGYLSGAVGIDVPSLGVEKFAFGSCIITSVGMLGIDEAYTPPAPFARVPAYIVITEMKKRPVVENDQVVIKTQLDLTATIDHRFIDGFRGAALAKVIKEGLHSPWQLDKMDCPF